jgi:hypothetical protein
MKKTAIIFLVLIVLNLSGCANVTPTGGKYKPLNLGSNDAELVIYRIGGFPLLAGDIAAAFRNGMQVGHSYHGTFIQESVSAGEHTITIQRSTNDRYFWRFPPVSITVQALQGQKIFVELDMTTFDSGFILPVGGIVGGATQSKISIKKIDEPEALTKIVDLKRVLTTDK